MTYYDNAIAHRQYVENAEIKLTIAITNALTKLGAKHISEEVKDLVYNITNCCSPTGEYHDIGAGAYKEAYVLNLNPDLIVKFISAENPPSARLLFTTKQSKTASATYLFPLIISLFSVLLSRSRMITKIAEISMTSKTNSLTSKTAIMKETSTPITFVFSLKSKLAANVVNPILMSNLMLTSPFPEQML